MSRSKFMNGLAAAALVVCVAPGAAPAASGAQPAAAGAAPAALAGAHEELVAQVRAAETAFAATMAARDHAAFGGFIAEEAVFFGGRGPLRGAAAVKEAWQRFFTEPAAPFSWRPEVVEVLDSGTLALSSGPVFDPEGKHIADFNSIWRREPDGRWLVVFDRGSDVCGSGEEP